MRLRKQKETAFAFALANKNSENLRQISGEDFSPISNLSVWNFVGGWRKTFSPKNFQKFFFFSFFDFLDRRIFSRQKFQTDRFENEKPSRAKIFSSRKRFSFPPETAGNPRLIKLISSVLSQCCRVFPNLIFGFSQSSCKND